MLGFDVLGLEMLGPDEELVSQQIGTRQSSPATTDTSFPHTNESRCVGNRTLSPSRCGQGKSASTMVVSPESGGQEGVLDEPEPPLPLELLDEELLELLDDELDELLELDDDELEELLELDELLELLELQHPSPSWITSHLRLSGIHFAQP